MNTEAISLPWVERLFARLQVRYGREWNAMWEGIEPDAVKADWEENLRGVFTRNPKAISYALEHLPERVPTSDQFLRVCRQAPWPELAQLPVPAEAPDPKRVEAALQAMHATRESLRPKSLAQQCIDNIETIVRNRGGAISSAQKHMVAHCLRMPGTSTALAVLAAGREEASA